MNDGSADGSGAIPRFAGRIRVSRWCITNELAAPIRMALQHATGDVVLVHDADLEQPR